MFYPSTFFTVGVFYFDILSVPILFHVLYCYQPFSSVFYYAESAEKVINREENVKHCKKNRKVYLYYDICHSGSFSLIVQTEVCRLSVC
jgi:hypothetical protein